MGWMCYLAIYFFKEKVGVCFRTSNSAPVRHSKKENEISRSAKRLNRSSKIKIKIQKERKKEGKKGKKERKKSNVIDSMN